MKNYITLLLCLWLTICVCSCTGQPSCNIQGTWIITSGSVFPNYELTNPYTTNRISFSPDSVELASGFFYATKSLYDENPIGRYPFMYYGSKEGYQLEGDSIFIHSNPYKTQRSFKIKCLSKDKLTLTGKNNTLHLIRNLKNPTPNSCNLKYIKVNVTKGSLDLFSVSYDVTFFDDDRLTFESPETAGKSLSFKLKQGTYQNICQGLNIAGVSKLKKVYPTPESDARVVRLEIGMHNGKVIRSEIHNVVGVDYPNDLRLALVPLLYTHQRFVDPKSPPVSWE